MSAEQQPADKLIGQVLANRYEILHRLGEGAMGTVYKARHVKVGRSFAVKVLHPRLLVDDKVAMRFEREAELAGRLRHANVVGVVDIGELDGMRYMVMDFAEGPDLAQLLVEAPMPAERILHLVRQMLEGLYHAHEQGLIHRDFKPENVIVERDTHGAEMPRIVDFGIAILRDGGEGADGGGRLTTNGLVLGTPHYMAPEQAVADPIDHRIDLFALGIVVYEMLSGRLPFDGTGAEVARANLLLDPPPIVQRVPYLEVDPLLEAFARRLLAKKRDARPPTAKAARELLDLIERDRRAAAAALGVAISERTPAVTAPADAQHRDSSQPWHPGPTAPMKPSPPGQPATPIEPPAVAPPVVALPAPPIAFSAPRPAQGSPRPPSIRTPPGWEAASRARRRRPWLIAGAILGAAAIASAVMLAGAGKVDELEPGDRVVMTPVGPDPTTASPAAVPPPAAAATDHKPGDPTTAATPTAATPTAAAPTAADPTATTTTAPRPQPGDSRRPDARSSTRPSPGTRTRVTPGVETRAPDRTAASTIHSRAGEPAATGRVEAGATDASRSDGKALDTAAPADSGGATPIGTKPSSMAGISPIAIQRLYYSIPPVLNQLPDDESRDLWAALRRHNVQGLMVGPQTERDRAAPQLSQILNEALARKATRSGVQQRGDKRKLRHDSLPDR